MQNIEQILSEFGIEVPADKRANLLKKVAENYKTIAEHEKATGKIEAERDKWKTQAETAEATLKGFEGIDPTKIQAELNTWKKKAEDAEKNAQAQIYERDFNDALKEQINAIKFSSEAAKKSVMAEIKEAGLKMKDGKILGATIMAPGAAEIIQEVAVMVRHGFSVVEIASTPHVASSWSDLVRLAARELI